jgi:hypothetical protein
MDENKNEIVSLNLDDLDVEELERRLELASMGVDQGAGVSCYVFASCGCLCL